MPESVNPCTDCTNFKLSSKPTALNQSHRKLWLRRLENISTLAPNRTYKKQAQCSNVVRTMRTTVHEYSRSVFRTYSRHGKTEATIGSELLIDAQTDKLVFRTLNSSRSSFLSITFKPQFFDAYNLSEPVVQCSVLLKSVCTVFRTPPGNIDRLAVILPTQDANKLQWTLECRSGMRKTYWISCNAEDDMQDVVVPRESLSSHLVVRPKDLNRLLANFQFSLSEITLIATEPVATPNGSEDPEAKAVELRSYFDTVKEGTEDTLHTQLWIDPAEELREYSHFGDAVDVTFSMKELKAFIVFCEGSEADMHMFFEKAGHPVLVAPRFGLDDAEHADFDATLVLATVQGSQIGPANSSAEARNGNGSQGTEARNLTTSQAQRRNDRNRGPTPGSMPDSDHTVIWSELTGSAGRVNSVRGRAAERESSEPDHSLDASEEIGFRYQRQQRNEASGNSSPARRAFPAENDTRAHNETDENSTGSDRLEQGRHAVDAVQQLDPGLTGGAPSVRNVPELGAQAAEPAFQSRTTMEPTPGGLSAAKQGHVTSTATNLRSWVTGDLEDDDDDDSNEEYCVESTPPDRRGL
ncbi:hypothetical protein R1flu_029152 [Riccia fluitans]|uniref:Cell cycle checkpoint control protein RAD9A n=1 Tax=Riccia fluitans TaxID=41844 RepID=A0ABD1XNS2_9MARC